MNHVLSTHLFVNSRLTSALLGKIQQTGIPAVEIFCARQHLDYRDKAQIKELGHWFRDSELKLHSLHSPMYSDEIWGRSGPHAVVSITETVKGARLQAVDEIKRALEISETIPFQYLIQHMGGPNEEFDMRKVDAAFSALEEIHLFARGRGVEVLLENIPNELSSAERLLQFNELTHVGLNFAFDTGHAHMATGVEAEFELMKERIRSTHVHDNNGVDDIHLVPLAENAEDRGTIDWKRTMELLRSRQDQYPLLLELKDRGNPHLLDSAIQAFDRLESLSS
ncbi:MAG: TIM barrel protein [Candidatus Solibacter sp.]